ncbi:MAG: hypothetical protein PVI11_03010 [Candidatus Aminicenantes bacterium]
MKKKSFLQKIIHLGILLLLMTAQSRPEDLFSVTGYLKNFSVLFMMPVYEFQEATIREPDLGAVNNRLRLNLDFHLSNRLSFHLAYDLSPKIQDPQLFQGNTFLGQLTLPQYRFDDFRDTLYPTPGKRVSSFGLFHNLDRFLVTVETDIADIFVGRQPLAWGCARFINPTDIIAPFAFNELDKEERRGVDAIRVRVPLGVMDELDLGFVAGQNFQSDNNAFFIRGKMYKFRTDISGILIGFRKHLLVGLDIARAIGEAGFWLECAYVIPDCFRENKEPKEENYFRSSIGMDYNLNSKTYGFIEYHFNSAGKNRPEEYIDLLSSSAYGEGSVYLLGKHYLNIGTIYELTPLMPFTGMVILNLSDRSLILSPTFEYNIAENIYLAAGAYIGLGKNPERVLGSLTPLPFFYQSEFGAYPDIIYTSFRIYF